MRLMFVYWRIGNAGSAQDILQYARVAKSLGHDVVIYAPEEPGSPFQCSLDLESADAVIFVFEWNLYLFPGGDKKKGRVYRDGLMGIGHLNVAKLFSRVPRGRRVILDCDGMYNDVTRVDGDYNHLDEAGSRARTELYDAISDNEYALDLLGNGTACLLWSSPLPCDARGPMRYIDLMGGQKPHLLIKILNNLNNVGAIEVNAFQSQADVVMQKSLREGFGLTVTEALWKVRPVIAGDVGGIPLQVRDGETGYLVSSPEEAAKRTIEVLRDPGLAKQLGRAGKERDEGSEVPLSSPRA